VTEKSANFIKKRGGSEGKSLQDPPFETDHRNFSAWQESKFGSLLFKKVAMLLCDAMTNANVTSWSLLGCASHIRQVVFSGDQCLRLPPAQPNEWQSLVDFEPILLKEQGG